MESEDATSIADSATTSKSKSHWRPKKYICQYEGCGKAFNRPVRLQAHENTHTGEKPYACSEQDCDKRFYKAEHLKAHAKNAHSSADQICTYVIHTDVNGNEVQCSKTFTTTSRLNRHIAVHEDKEERKCEHCGQQFRKMETLQQHLRKEHLIEEESFRCTALVMRIPEERFSEEFDELEGLQECGEMFTSAGKLARHKTRDHVVKSFACPRCPDNISNQIQSENATYAMSIDQDLPSHPAVFSTYGDLLAHIREEHPHTCSTCGTICISPSALRAHIDIHHGSSLTERQIHPCTWPGCDRSFTKKGNLSVHIQSVHVKTKKYVCGEYDLSKSAKVKGWDGQGCGVGFTAKSSLENHIQTQHMGLSKPMRPSRLRKEVKFEEEEDDMQDLMPFLAADSATPTDSVPTPSNTNMLGLLTGAWYAENRPFACLAASLGCAHRFTNEFYLAQHMELSHGWSTAQVNDGLAGASNQDSQGGVGFDFDTGNDAFMTEGAAVGAGGEFRLTGTTFDTQKGTYNYAVPLVGLDEMFEKEAMVLDPVLMNM